MTEILSVAIGVGLAVSLIFSELFGLAAGGMVVPGYFALFLHRPLDILVTVAAALATYLVVQLLGTFVIIYGKRRTVLMILTGYLIGMFVDYLAIEELAILRTTRLAGADFSVIGFIIPGLIAIWFDRQGVVETLSALATASVVIRLILILIYGSQLQVVLP